MNILLVESETGRSKLARADLIYDHQSRGCQTLDSDFTTLVNGVVSQPQVNDRGGWEIHNPCSPPGFYFSRPLTLTDLAVVEMRSGPDRLVAEVEFLGQALGGQPM